MLPIFPVPFFSTPESNEDPSLPFDVTISLMLSVAGAQFVFVFRDIDAFQMGYSFHSDT